MADEPQTPQESPIPETPESVAAFLETPAVEAPASDVAAVETPEATPDAPAASLPDIPEDRLLLEAMRNYSEVEGLDIDLVDKYANDRELLRGIQNLRRLASQRDADAEFGRRVRDQYGDVFQQPPPAPQTPPQASEPQSPPTIQEIRYLESMIQKNPETGALEPIPGAPSDVVQKLTTIRERMQQVMLDLAFQPEKVIGTHLDQIKSQASQEAVAAAQRLAREQQDRAELMEWRDNNKAWLFQGGQPNAQANNFTVHGSRLGEILAVNGPRLAAAGYSPVETLNICLNQLRASLPPTQPTPTPPPQARHTPNVATGPGTPEDPMKPRDGETLGEWLVRTGQPI